MMATDTLRMIVGFSIIISHIVSFAMILFLGNDLLPEQRQELALLISPMFAVYVASIVRKFATLVSFDRTPVHPAFTILGIGTALVFSVAVPYVVFSFENHSIMTFGELKTSLSIIETALGIYTGAVVDRLFGIVNGRRSVPPAATGGKPPKNQVPGAARARAKR
jgi:hypothetical protein